MMSDRWRPLTVPAICERMLGFSVPQNDTVLIVSYEGMHLIRLGEPITVETDSNYTGYDLYDPDTSVCDYQSAKWEMIGLRPGHPILLAPDGEKIALEKASLTISVVIDGRANWSSTFDNFSGDWAAATFSPDGRFIVLGCPYGFDFRVWERVPA